MKVFDLLWKREEKPDEKRGEKKDCKVHWENVGVLIENEGKRAIKLNLVPVGDWDGWLTVVERKERSAANESKS